METKNTAPYWWSILCCAWALSADAGSGTWTNLNGGSWANAANWSGGIIAANTDATAYFSALNLAADAAVTLDGTLTIGNMVFRDTTPDHNWMLSPGSGGFLVLSLSSGSPVITVNNQTATLGVVLTGTQGMAKAGAGTLVLASANTYSDVTAINNGILALGPNGSIAGSTTIIITPGAVFDVSTPGGFMLGLGKTYRLLTYGGTLSGSVTNLTLTGYSFAANNQDWRLAADAGAVTLTVSGWQPTLSAILPYVIAASPWPIDQRGNQRIVVSVTQAVDAVRVDLPWRRVEIYTR